MTKELYDSLSEKERFLYNEMADFARRLTDQQEEIIGLLRKILDEANG